MKKTYLLALLAFMLNPLFRLAAQDCPPPPAGSCSLICNPNFVDPNCTGIWQDALMPPGYLLIAVDDCSNYPGWDNLYLTPDYIDAGWTTPSGDGKGVRMVAVGDIEGTGCNNTESLITPVDVEPNKHYILTYDRAGYYPWEPLTGPPGGTATPPLPICDDCGISQNVLFATHMDRFLVRLTNEADISWDYTSTLYCNAQANPPDQYATITPSGLDAAANAYTEANIPGDMTSGIQWRKVAMCFSTGANDSWDRLYVHPLQLGTNSYIIALLDRLRLIEDDFPTLQTEHEICDGEAVQIGSNFCTDDTPDFVFAWEVFDGSTWNTITGATEPALNVEPAATTTYRLTRTMLADPGIPFDNYYDCANASVEITVNIVESTECCMEETAGTYETIPATIASGTWSYGVGNNPWDATSGPVRLNGDVVVAAGVSLTINNMQFEMGPIGRVVVERGGILHLNNCDFYGDPVCETMWQGMQVHGPGLTAGFTTSNTGFLYLSNVAILDAIMGVATMRIPLLNLATINLAVQNNYHEFVSATATTLFELWDPYVYDYAGGYLDIDRYAAPTKFEDCLIGINISYRAGVDVIENAFFNDNGDQLYYPYQDLPEMETGIYSIVANAGYTIQDCTFWDCRWGIRANETPRMTVRDCGFERCRVGVSSRNYFNPITQTTRIYDNTFEKCWVGVQLDANSAAFVKDNQINQLTDVSYYNEPGNYPLGIYMRGSDFDIRNNFVKDVHGGLVFTDCDHNGAIAGGNEIREAVYGIYSHGDNAGVELWCNHIINYASIGLCLVEHDVAMIPGTLGQQGNCDNIPGQPAGNTFLAAPGAFFDIFFGFNTNDLTYHDVNATSLSWFSFSAATLLPTDCDNSINIDAYCGGLGYKALSEISLMSDDIEKNKELTAWLMKYLEEEDYTAAIDLINNYNSSMTDRKKLLLDYENGNLAAAEQKLQALPDAREEDVRFKQYYQILLDLKANSQAVWDIDETQESALLDIAGSPTKTAYRAQALLYVAKGMEFPVLLPDFDGNTYYTSFKTGNLGKTPLFTPNVVKDVAYMGYDFGNEGSAKLAIYDLSGNLVKAARLTGTGTYGLDVQQMPQGVYLYNIAQSDGTVGRGKFVVIK